MKNSINFCKTQNIDRCASNCHFTNKGLLIVDTCNCLFNDMNLQPLTLIFFVGADASIMEAP